MTETQSNSAHDTLLLTLTGRDRPAVAGQFLSALADTAAVVVDIEQVVARGQLTLAVLVRADDLDSVSSRAHAWAQTTGLQLTTEIGVGDNHRRRAGRANVVVLAVSLPIDSVAALTTRIGELGGNIDRVRRLSREPLTTLELDVSGADVAVLRRELALTAAQVGVDVAVAPGGLDRRGSRLLVMDVDSTLIQDEVIELLARHAGRGAEVAAVTEQAMRGELDFAQSLHARVATLAGLPVSVFDQVRNDIRLTPGARTLVRTVKRLGFTVAVVSGGFIEIVGPLAAELGIDHAHANTLEVADGKLTGAVTGTIVDRAEKANALRAFAKAEQLPLSRTVAVGDGANDLDMLAIAGMGIAFNAKPIVRDQAQTSLNVPFLDAVLSLLGIGSDEIAEAGCATASAPTP